MIQMANHQNSECPVCGGERFDERLDTFDRLCDDCGFVIRGGTDSELMVWKLDGDESQELDCKDWLTECRVHNATEQQIAKALDAVEDIADHLDVPKKMRHEAADIYCESFKAKVTDGRDTVAIAAACLRLSSLRLTNPIPSNRLIESTDTDQKKFRLSLAAIQEVLETQPQTPKPEDYVPFIGTTLDLDDSQLQDVERLLKNITREPSLVGKDPAGIAAAGVYLIQGDQTQLEIAKAAGVSTETIRQRVNQLQELMDYG